MQPVAPPRRITIVDVARHAQVSTTAVSKVLNNAYGASPAMREKVRRAIDELGYRPYAAARGLRGQTYTIGVMLPNIRNPFFPDILDGVTTTWATPTTRCCSDRAATAKRPRPASPRR
jgi:LacI family transcriptional regulator